MRNRSTEQIPLLWTGDDADEELGLLELREQLHSLDSQQECIKARRKEVAALYQDAEDLHFARIRARQEALQEQRRQANAEAVEAEAEPGTGTVLVRHEFPLDGTIDAGYVASEMAGATL